MATRRAFVVALLVGSAIRVWALTTSGTTDTLIWKVWSFAAAHDVTAMYGVGGVPPERRVLHWRGVEMTVDYPPVSLYELALVGRAYQALRPAFDDSRWLNVAVKMPGLVAELWLLVWFYGWARREAGEPEARWGTAALWLNPAVLLNGPFMGYLDLQMAVPLAIAVGVAWRGQAAATGALAALALATKAQAVFVMPVLAAILLWRSLGVRTAVRAAAVGAGVLAATVVPFIARGAWHNLTQALGRLATHDMLSAQAANVWWLVTWWLRVADDWADRGPWEALSQPLRILGIERAIALGVPNPRLVGLVLVVAALSWICFRIRRAATPAAAWAGAALAMFAYALLAAQVHENHLTPAVVLLGPAAALDRRFRNVFWMTSAVVALNLYLFYGLGQDHPPVFSRSVTGIDATALLALVSIGTFVWLGLRLGSVTSSGPARVTAGQL